MQEKEATKQPKNVIANNRALEENGIEENMKLLPVMLHNIFDPKLTQESFIFLVNFLPAHADLINEEIIDAFISCYSNPSDENTDVLSNISTLLFKVLSMKGKEIDSIRNLLLEKDIVSILYPTLFPFFKTPLVLFVLLRNNPELAVFLLQENVLNEILGALNDQSDYNSLFFLLYEFSRYSIPNVSEYVCELTNIVFSSKDYDFITQGLLCISKFIDESPAQVPYIIDSIFQLDLSNAEFLKAAITFISHAIPLVTSSEKISICYSFVSECLHNEDEIVKINAADAIINGGNPFAAMFSNVDIISFFGELLDQNSSSALLSKLIGALCSIFIVSTAELQGVIFTEKFADLLLNNLELVSKVAFSRPFEVILISLRKEEICEELIDKIDSLGVIDFIQRIADMPSDECDEDMQQVAAEIISIIESE